MANENNHVEFEWS